MQFKHAGEMKNPELFLSIVKAHLPEGKSGWFVTDKLLKECVDALESVLTVNKALKFENELFARRLFEKNGGEPWGSITVDRIQPSRIWALTSRVNGKREVAFSLDGPPSKAYVEFVDLLSMKGEIQRLESQLSSKDKEIEHLKSEIALFKKYEDERLKASYEHANSPAVKRMKEAVDKTYWPTWEAGRSFGFRASLDHIQALKAELALAKNETVVFKKLFLLSGNGQRE